MKQTLHIWSSEEEKSKWKKAIFIFDTSVLLNFYSFSEHSLATIFSSMEKSLKDRLWITNRIEYEYLKNRHTVINDPIKLYTELQKEHDLSVTFKKLLNNYQQLKNKTLKDQKHPYLPNELFTEFDATISSFETELDKFETQIENTIKGQILKIGNRQDNDPIKSRIEEIFKIGKGYSYDKLTEIAKEGEFRYRNTIPPGYEDAKNKLGFSRYGDLIIWFQIIDLALEHKTPIVFICDDLKEDWCIKGKRNRDNYPREELVKEISDKCNTEFAFYSFEEFLYKSKNIFGDGVEDAIIVEAQQIKIQSLTSDNIDDIMFNWVKEKFSHMDMVKRAMDFEAHDSGVDFITAIDGVAFGIKYKLISSRPSIERIRDIITKEAVAYEESSYSFESGSLVFVCESEELALYIKPALTYIPKRILPFDLMSGYIKDDKFILVHSDF